MKNLFRKKAVTNIKSLMTPIKRVVGLRTDLLEARSILRGSKIRHLPVIDLKGKPVGILSDRDVKFACSLTGGNKCAVANVMTPNPYVVSEQTSILEVISEMSRLKIGSALVVDGLGVVCGIYTTTDAMKLLLEKLKPKKKRSA